MNMKQTMNLHGSFKEMFGRNMRVLRKSSGVTGEQFAELLGISRNHLHRIENAVAYGISFNALHYLRSQIDLDTFFREDIEAKLNKITKTIIQRTSSEDGQKEKRKWDKQ